MRVDYNINRIVFHFSENISTIWNKVQLKEYQTLIALKRAFCTFTARLTQHFTKLEFTNFSRKVCFYETIARRITFHVFQSFKKGSLCMQGLCCTATKRDYCVSSNSFTYSKPIPLKMRKICRSPRLGSSPSLILQTSSYSALDLYSTSQFERKLVSISSQYNQIPLIFQARCPFSLQ